MPGWFTFFLTLHILLVIVAFGPSFAYAIVVGMARKEPQHSLFAARFVETVSTKLTVPLAIIVPFTGVALIYSAPGEINLWKSEWLVAAIVIYTVLFFYALGVQIPTTRKLIGILQTMPPGPPPPEVPALGKRLQLGGMFMTMMLVVILVLMVWQPGNCQGVC